MTHPLYRFQRIGTPASLVLIALTLIVLAFQARTANVQRTEIVHRQADQLTLLQAIRTAPVCPGARGDLGGLPSVAP